MKTKIVFSAKCLEYASWHVEGPERVKKAYEILRERNYQFLAPKSAREEDILRVHDPNYVQRLKDGFVEDADTPAYQGIYEYARLAAGGAILASEVGGFSLMRPPGHHAGIRGTALGARTKGFCYLNNIAIAVKRLDKPALILDIDGHHGNGTQEIFSGESNATYVGLHRYPLYPGTGYSSESNYVNFPLMADCGDEVYLKTFDKALSMVKTEEIEIVGVSAGFDTHTGDLASLGLTEAGFKKLGRRIGDIDKHTFFVLEGGYSGENNGKDIDGMISGYESVRC